MCHGQDNNLVRRPLPQANRLQDTKSADAHHGLARRAFIRFKFGSNLAY